MGHDAKQVRPIHCVKHFGVVYIDEHVGLFLFMQVSNSLLQINIAIMDASLFNEGCLVCRDQLL
jgi:hypothetical protein